MSTGDCAVHDCVSRVDDRVVWCRRMCGVMWCGVKDSVDDYVDDCADDWLRVDVLPVSALETVVVR